DVPPGDLVPNSPNGRSAHAELSSHGLLCSVAVADRQNLSLGQVRHAVDLAPVAPLPGLLSSARVAVPPRPAPLVVAVQDGCTGDRGLLAIPTSLISFFMECSWATGPTRTTSMATIRQANVGSLEPRGPASPVGL